MGIGPIGLLSLCGHTEMGLTCVLCGSEVKSFEKVHEFCNDSQLGYLKFTT